MSDALFSWIDFRDTFEKLKISISEISRYNFTTIKWAESAINRTLSNIEKNNK